MAPQDKNVSSSSECTELYAHHNSQDKRALAKQVIPSASQVLVNSYPNFQVILSCYF